VASTQTWTEYGGTGGTVVVTGQTQMNWMTLDGAASSAVAYSASNAVIPAGSNSMTKYQAIRFAGTWNSLSSLSYTLTTQTPTDNLGSANFLTVCAALCTATTYSSSYGLTTPTGGGQTTGTFGTTGSFTTGYTASTLAGSLVGFPVSSSLGTSAPLGATTNFLYSTAYSAQTVAAEALETQLLTNASTNPGDIQTVTLTARWTES
jgi:hypothetical protein